MEKKYLNRLTCMIVSIVSVCFMSCGPDPEPPADSISVSDTVIDFGENGGSKTIQVSSNTAWNVSNVPTWLKVSPMQGSGNGTIMLEADANSETDNRVGTIQLVAGTAKTGITVRQKASLYEAYAVLSNNNQVLTFYYDDKKSIRNGLSIEVSVEQHVASWHSNSGKITTVVFDNSFAKYNGLSNISYWFNGCEKLTTLTGIRNLKTDNVWNMKSLFKGCSSLNSLDLSGFNTKKVQWMESMFEDCSSLRSLNIDNFNTENVIYMCSMFYNCSSLKSLNLRSFNTANVKDMEFLFHNCSNLKSLDLSSFNTSNVKNMDWMFSGCSSLQTIYVSTWNLDKAEQGWSMFFGCENLVGGMGSSYEHYSGATGGEGWGFAHIDEGPSNPGYFTYKAR